MSRVYMIAATILSGLTLALVYYCTQIRWAPRVDFDILGFLWVLQNLAQLTLVAMTLFFGVAALYCWVQGAIRNS